MSNFNNLGISKELLTNLNFLKLINPTPIQKMAIKPALEGKDILASAKTGTGKTAAFGIPLIQKLNENKQSNAIVLTPTRELSIQIDKHLKDLMGQNVNIKSVVIIGGESIQKQIKLIKKKPQLIIGTPGRVCDHLNRGTLKLDNINYLVLDETDRMLDLGFSLQIKKILKFIPQKRQTLLFSATIPTNIEKISEEYLQNPIRISIADDKQLLTNIEHDVVNLTSKEKYDKLLEEIDSRTGSIIIFMKTKHSSKKMCLKLQKYGLSVNTIHGNVRQSKRISILNNFRKKKYRILVATDVASRGLDIPHIKHVINYDLPQNSEDYIHRIGRTARAGSSGAAICFITEKDKKLWKIISKKINSDIQPHNDDVFNNEYKEQKNKNFSKPQSRYAKLKKFNSNKRISPKSFTDQNYDSESSTLKKNGREKRKTKKYISKYKTEKYEKDPKETINHKKKSFFTKRSIKKTSIKKTSIKNKNSFNKRKVNEHLSFDNNDSLIKSKPNKKFLKNKQNQKKKKNNKSLNKALKKNRVKKKR